MLIQLFNLFILMPLMSICNECNLEPSFPSHLLYQGKPIPDSLLVDFLGYAVVPFGETNLELNIPKRMEFEKTLSKINAQEERDDEEEYCKPKITFEMEYIGALYKEFQAIRVYTWEKGCLSKFTGILILKREGDILKISDIIYGGDRHSSMICEGAQIRGNIIVFRQTASTGSLIEESIQLYPELNEVYASSSCLKICYGEVGYCGSFEKTAEITPEGKVKRIDLISFSPCEGCEREDAIYKKEGLKGLALDLLIEEAPF